MLTVLEEIRAEFLAKHGWFSHRFIAGKVFHKSFENVSKQQINAVRSHLIKQRILVTQARDGMTYQAKQRLKELNDKFAGELENKALRLNKERA